MIRIAIIALFAAVLMLSCKSTTPSDEDPDWIRNKPGGPDLGVPIRILESKTEQWLDVTAPVDQKRYSYGRVYVASVSKVFYNHRFGFLISGDLPNACSELHSITAELKGDEIVLQVQSRQDADMMCAEVLRPFDTFFDQVTEEDFARLKSWKSDEALGSFEK
jgi:hypothetical protein